jgi:NAD(P)-dependent dehydrogenase (short-subunit alcohol dehydrogenase family)
MSTICITGASRGIGYGFAQAYLNGGHRVFGAVRDTSGSGVQQLQSSFPDTFTPVAMDVRDPDSVQGAVGEIEKQAGSLDLLINNAGVAPAPNEQSLTDVDEEEVMRVFDVNTVGPLRCVKAFVLLLKQGMSPKVVMISSSAGSIAGQGGGRGVPYCVSKAGLNMLTKLLYFHLRDEGIATTAIHPGWVRTDMGGSSGALSVEESVTAMQKLIDRLGFDSPIYQDYRGTEMAF